MHKPALGIDIDGVITAAPKFFASLSNRYRQEGKQVHIVSSRSNQTEARQATIKELHEFGIAYDHLYLLPSIEVAQQRCMIAGLDWYQKYLWQKINYGIEQGITLFYDDDAKVVELFKSIAPEIKVIHFVNDER